MKFASDVFDSIAGLPVHPLVVHAAVVLLPLACLGLLACWPVRRWRTRYGALTWLMLVAGSVSVLVAKESGERLAGHLGLPADHAQWADRLVVATAVLDVLATAWLGTHLLTHRRRTTPSGARRPRQAEAGATEARDSAASPAARGADTRATSILGALTALAAIGVLALTVVTGHTGAQASWGGSLSTAAPTPSSTPTSATTSGGASGTGSDSTTASTMTGSSGTTSSPGAAGAGASTSASATYTLAQVAGHNTAQSCWTAINGAVYDVTSWISQHPGGQGSILGLCGKDGTNAFTSQHGGQTRPNTELATFKIGSLGN